jgi:Gpi18-like mannosyltransferase
MKKLVLIIFIWLITIFSVNKVSARILFDKTSYELPYRTPFAFSLAPLLNMDARLYLDIACRGYSVRNGFDSRVFFPVYPLLIRTLSLNCLLNPVIIGLGVSILSFVGVLFILSKMLKKNIRLKTLSLLLFFPTSFFFAAYYTESTFLLFVLLTFWFLDKKKYLPASVFAALASATRLPGIVLAIVIFYEAYMDYRKNKKIHGEIFLAPLGLIFFSIYNWFSTGSVLTFITSQTYWNRPVGFSAPFYGLIRQAVNVFSGPLSSYDSPFVYPVILIEFGVFVYLLVILYFSYKKIKMSYWIYMLVSFVFILFAGPSSSPRYALVLFPAFIYLGQKLSGLKYLTYLVCSYALFVFMACLFLRGYWSS